MKKTLLALAAGLMLATTAQASLVTFEYVGYCEKRCGKIGLSRDSLVGGYLTTTYEALLDGRLFGDEIESFGFNFGLATISSDTHEAVGQMALSDNFLGAVLPGVQFLSGFGDPFFQDTGGFSFLGRPNAETNAFFREITTWSVSRPGKDPWGFGAYVDVNTDRVEVAEPGTLALLGLGLFGAAAARRRKAA